MSRKPQNYSIHTYEKDARTPFAEKFGFEELGWMIGRMNGKKFFIV